MLVIEDKEGNVNQGTKAGILSRIEELQLDPMFTDTKKPAEINSNLNKNMALFKGYSTEDQVKQVKALNQVTSIWYEEAEKVTKDQVEDLYFQLRGGKPEDRKLYLTLNPVNEYCYANEALINTKHDEILEYFPGTKRPKVFIKYVTTEFMYNGKMESVRLKHLVVLTTHHDNSFLEIKQRAAIEALKDTDINKWKQLAEARFTRSGLTFFSEFDRDIHVIDPFVIPNHWERYISLDYGLDMLAVLWHAIDERGNDFIYKELNESNLIISEAAKRILEVNGSDKISIKYAPGDLWNRRQETGKSAYDIFLENGVVLHQSNRNRSSGSLNMKEWFKVIEERDTHTGQLIKTSCKKVFNTCTTYIKHIMSVLSDEKDSNCYANQPHELTHIIDADRYFSIMRISPSAKYNEIIKPSSRNFVDKPKPDPYNQGYSSNFMSQF